MAPEAGERVSPERGSWGVPTERVACGKHLRKQWGPLSCSWREEEEGCGRGERKEGTVDWNSSNSTFVANTLTTFWQKAGLYAFKPPTERRSPKHFRALTPHMATEYARPCAQSQGYTDKGEGFLECLSSGNSLSSLEENENLEPCRDYNTLKWMLNLALSALDNTLSLELFQLQMPEPAEHYEMQGRGSQLGSGLCGLCS